jgi:arginine/serine-rich splicing factor 4/5/6
MSRKVYLGRLNNQVREKDVDRFFKGFRVRSIMLKNGYGFVVCYYLLLRLISFKL